MFVILIPLLTGCQGRSVPIAASDEASSRKPTTTEVFNLRSKCADLGAKVITETIVGSDLTQSETSHYNPKTNRCYVRVDVNMIDLSKVMDYFSITLYDGQTRELLASVSNKKGEKRFVNELGTSDYEGTLETINSVMSDDRSQ